MNQARHSLLAYLKRKDWAASGAVLKENPDNTQADLDFFYEKGLVDFEEPFGNPQFVRITEKGRYALLGWRERIAGYIVSHWIELCILVIAAITLFLTLRSDPASSSGNTDPSQTIATWIAAVAAAFAVVVAWWAARWAKRIGEKQNEINKGIKSLQEKQTDAEHFVELSLQAKPVDFLPEARATGYFQPQNVDLVVKNVGTYTVYLTRYYTQKNAPQLLEYSAVPPDGYRIPISKDDFGGDGVLVLTIEFEDYRQTKYKSVHTIVFPKQGARLEIRSKKRERLE